MGNKLLLQKLSVNSSEPRAVVVLEGKKNRSIQEILKGMNVELKEGQRAVVVVLDDLSQQQLSTVKSAFSLMQGVKAVVDVFGGSEQRTLFES